MSFDYSNFTNTPFAVTYSGTFFKIAFGAPLNQNFYFNRELYNVKYSDLGSNFVDLGEFDWGILTVNYTLATAPVAGSRALWIEAVNALITFPIPNVPSLATGALTDYTVGWNASTLKLTSLGQTQLQRLRVTRSTAVAIPTVAAALPYNVINDDPLNSWNAATFTYTVPQTGVYILNQASVNAGASSSANYFTINGTQVNLVSTSVATNTITSTVVRLLSAGDTVQLFQYALAGGDTTVAVPPNLVFMEIKRAV